MRAACATLAARSTKLIAAEHRVCLGTVRLIDAGTRFAKVETTCGEDVGCFAGEMSRLEQATRGLARLVRAERRAVAERRLRGACARAFENDTDLEMLDETAGARRQMRRAMPAGDVEAVERAGRRIDRASELEGEDSATSARRLRTCPRV